MRTSSRCLFRGAAAALLAAIPLLASHIESARGEGAPTAASAPSPAAQVEAKEALYPPWQKGRNNDAVTRGFLFTVPPMDDLADFHGSLTDPALVLYVGGNYYFALAPLVAEFGREFPRYRGHIYYETLPPGILAQQIRAGGTITTGNMTWTVKPDVYLAGLGKVNDLIKAGLLVGPAVPYITNELTIMVPAGNPGHVTGLADLGRPDLPVVMPNPRFEGVARQIRASLVKAGGEALANAVYGAKVQDGTTILTRIHHRQTPLFLMQGLAKGGVTWISEAIFQEQVGHPITHVAIPAADNTTAVYAAAVAKGAAHREAAQAWLHFIHSDPAIAIFERYGFRRYQSAGGNGRGPELRAHSANSQ